MIQACHIPAAAVPEHWQDLVPLIEVFIEESSGRYALEDVLMMLALGKWDVWAAWEDGVLTSMLLGYVVQYPRLRAYEPFGVVGHNMRAWLKFYPEFENWVRTERGCSLIRPTAPLGWERVLKPMGYSKSHVVLIKEL